MLDGAFDILLSVTLIWLAWASLSSTDLFRGIVLFVAFGLVLALSWVRLGAIDIALAEAAIGAGLTGALLLAALARLNVDDTLPDGASQGVFPGAIHAGSRLLTPALALILVAALAAALFRLSAEGTGLAGDVSANLKASGVKNPVTAVIVVFRGYDTMLEMAVLLLVVVAVLALGRSAALPLRTSSIILFYLECLLLPLMVLVAGYLLWVGSHAPGGAFQAGSVLAAAGVLTLLTGRSMPAGGHIRWLALILTLGLAGFLVLGGTALMFGGHFLAFPRDNTGVYVLMIEAVATLSIGATLTVLFLGGSLAGDRGE